MRVSEALDLGSIPNAATLKPRFQLGSGAFAFRLGGVIHLGKMSTRMIKKPNVTI
jgi:hypothetical protein